MKVFRIQCYCYDEYGESQYLLPDVYISRKVANKHKPENKEYPNEEFEYHIIEQEIIEN